MDFAKRAAGCAVELAARCPLPAAQSRPASRSSSSSQNFGLGIFGRPVVVPVGAGCEPPVVVPPPVVPPVVGPPEVEPPGNVGRGIVGNPGSVEGITTGGNVDGITGTVDVGAAVPVGDVVGCEVGVGEGLPVAVGLAGVIGGGGGGV